jgi:chitinase
LGIYLLMDSILVRYLLFHQNFANSNIDNENNDSAYYEILGYTFRTLFSTSISKDFYLLAAPQCPNLDASDPTFLLLLCDFVWVQFYNNPPCNIRSDGFATSLQGWSQILSSSKTHLYLGASAWPGADNTTYKYIGTTKGMETVAQNVKKIDLCNFGGVMFWDRPEGMLNEDNRSNIIAWAKIGLTI